jgi:hypothetical protein
MTEINVYVRHHEPREVQMNLRGGPSLADMACAAFLCEDAAQRQQAGRGRSIPLADEWQERHEDLKASQLLAMEFEGGGFTAAFHGAVLSVWQLLAASQWLRQQLQVQAVVAALTQLNAAARQQQIVQAVLGDGKPRIHVP